MNISGIIVEYNPFHNGHYHHIKETIRLTNPDLLIAVTSGNYNQRGDLSIIDKFEKTKAALDHGVNLVVELPYIYTVQNANVFANKAIEILNKLHVNNIVFGSETNNLEELKKYAELEVDVNRLKEYMHDGTSYPKAYGLLSSYLYSNDMLAVNYLKAIKNTDITAYSIQRTNNYHSSDLDIISSASAIRKAIKENKDISKVTPIEINNPIFNDVLYDYLRPYLLLTDREELKEYFLVEEGIEKHLKDNAYKYDNYEDFISACISRRYTRARIQRTLLHIANQIKKDDVKKLNDLNYIRVLGFDNKGQQLLKELKEEINIVTKFKDIPEPYKDMEWKAALLYATLTNDFESSIKKELGKIIIK